MNTLYFGDNLEVMREMSDQRVDLICTDPPFNSGRDYNAFLTDSLAQSKAFTDTWIWDDPAQDSRADIERRARTSDAYKALDTCLKGYDLVLQNAVSGNKGATRAYLAFMGPRLVEMHRILKDTGSIYLHCDPTASHYLKGVMDAIWDQDNHSKNEYFRNEIVWCYRGGGVPKKYFSRKHDIIFRYAKTNNITFNVDDIRQPYSEKSQERLKYKARAFRGDRVYDNYNMNEKGKHPEDWWVMQPVMPSSKERLGYPTQKPRSLYDRMIKASSNEGDLVMDPFAGCGTTIDAAETLNRFWIGIDPMRRRLADRHGLQPSRDYEIHGYPTNMQEVHMLVRDERKYHDFSNWAVTRLGLQPTKSVGDGGKDGEAEVGHITLWDPEDGQTTNTRILAEVKSGTPTIGQVRAFCHTMNKHDAIGVFITIKPVSDGMRQEAADMGTFSHNNVTYPRLQFWQIDDTYFENPSRLQELIRLPAAWLEPTRRMERHFTDAQINFNLRGNVD
ncbi:MAG: site-specific DNA-methyltransferase [Candidatus Poribacteria bacterium]|nr:site-specific DNA-methyltransferase [Candidatus Poribacteria bacterium]